MPALIFEYEKTLPQEFLNTCIGNEPNNSLVQYGLVADRQVNDRTNIENNNYTSLIWENFPSTLSSQAIKRIGIKSFPQIGAIGFFTLLYENTSFILAPIFTESTYYPAPTLEIIQNYDTLTLTVVDPDSTTYDCYRVVIRNGYFAYEYVSYEVTFTVPKPPTGVYDFTVEGYLEDRLASHTLKYTGISITNPHPVPTPIGDTVYSVNNRAADINGNVTVEAQHVPFSAEGFMATDVLSAIIEASTGAEATTGSLLIANWSSNQQTITVEGVTTTNIVLVAPIPAHQSGYTAANVVCVSQGMDSLTFQCATIPLIDIDVQVVIL